MVAPVVYLVVRPYTCESSVLFPGAVRYPVEFFQRYLKEYFERAVIYESTLYGFMNKLVNKMISYSHESSDFMI